MATSADRRAWSEDLLGRLLPHLTRTGEIGESEEVESVRHIDGHSNDLMEIWVSGRPLMVKRGVEDWTEPRFRGARVAARMLAETDIRAPRHLDVPDRIDGCSVLAWWKIPLNTVAGTWPDLQAPERHRLLRTCGRLLRRLHSVDVPGFGLLAHVVEDGESAASFLHRDLADRLRPVLEAEWPEAVPAQEALLGHVPRVASRAGPPRLVHGDPNLSNLLLRSGDGPRCVGVLDLEAAMGGPAEADLAYVQLVHSPLLAGTPEQGWMRSLLEGYGGRPDPVLTVFFHAYHLLNIGLHEALTGNHGHARDLAVAARSASAALGEPELVRVDRTPPYLSHGEVA